MEFTDVAGMSWEMKRATVSDEFVVPIWQAQGTAKRQCTRFPCWMTVVLHFVEISKGTFSKGAQVFDASVEGKPMSTNLDVCKEVGSFCQVVCQICSITVVTRSCCQSFDARWLPENTCSETCWLLALVVLGGLTALGSFG